MHGLPDHWGIVDAERCKLEREASLIPLHHYGVGLASGCAPGSCSGVSDPGNSDSLDIAMADWSSDFEQVRAGPL